MSAEKSFRKIRVTRRCIMGYRFTLEEANIIAHLVDGKVYTFLENAMKSEEGLDHNLQCLQDVLKQFRKNYYTVDKKFFLDSSNQIDDYRNQLNKIDWDEIKQAAIRMEVTSFEILKNNSKIKRGLDLLFKIHNVLGKAKVKSMLVPGFIHNQLNSELISEDLIKELVKFHPKDSCLILQVKEIPMENELYLYNAFRSMKTVANKVSEWPGVVLWNEKDTKFIPIRSIEQVFDIYNYLHYNGGDFAGLDGDRTRNSYIFHISDLHLGDPASNRRKSRLITLLENEIHNSEKDALIYPVVTGDIMDSPDENNKFLWEDFKRSLMSIGTQEAICVLGNHDIDNNGIGFSGRRRKAIINSLTTENIKVLEELNIAILKFNSTAGGNIAQGEIGEAQLIEMGNEVDKIKRNYNNLRYLAILHHHPVSIKRPQWSALRWYEKWLGGLYDETLRLVDADRFLDWLRHRGIGLVLHGHKHIPCIQDSQSINVIACGSSTGKVVHIDENKTYMSYNILKFDMDKKKFMSCVTKVEEIAGAGAQHVYAKRWENGI